MLAQLVQTIRLPGEPLDIFLRNCARKIAHVAKSEGDWGTQHTHRVLAFAAHMLRRRNVSSLATTLFKCYDARWLQARRHKCAGGSNRLGVRLFAAHVQRRWDEALLEARFRI